jgi:peptidoglycan/xylan/chitin deacetylase (PgdA/CDA1 family)
MKISNENLLRGIFAFKGYFKKGKVPEGKMLKGVEIPAYKNAAMAAFCISADFELNWAFMGRTPFERDLRGQRSRLNFPYILKILEYYKVPITWATVGHLFLKECMREPGGLAHSDMPRPPKNDRWLGDWYIQDPCTNYIKDPLWYAPDLISEILKSKVKHEIGIHSFSHIDFSQQYSSKELIRREIEACIAVMKKLKLKPMSIVFPFNKMGYSYMDILSDCGIIVVRHRDKKIRISYPQRDESGIYRTYESMNLRIAKHYDTRKKAKIFIDHALKNKGLVHLWFHPSDAFEIFFREFEPIVKYISEIKNTLNLWIATMGEIAGYCEARERVQIEREDSNGKSKIILVSNFDFEKYGFPEISLILPNSEFNNKPVLRINNSVREIEVNKPFDNKHNDKIIFNVSINSRRIEIMI